MNNTINTKRFIYCFSMLLAVSIFIITAYSVAFADTLYTSDGSVYQDVKIISDTADSITIRLDEKNLKEIQRKDILRLSSLKLKPWKRYVCKRNGDFFSAYLVDRDETNYTFRNDLYKADEYTVKRNEVYYIADKNLSELIAEGIIKKDSVSFDLLSIIGLVGFSQGLLFALLLFKVRTGNRRANRFLALFLVSLSFTIFNSFYLYTGLFFKFPHLLEINETPFRLLSGPLLYWYVSALTIPSFRLKKKDILHLLPAVLITAWRCRYLIFLSGEQKILLLIYYKPNVDVIDSIIWHFFVFQFWIYLFWVIYLLTMHKKRIKGLFSSIESINLAWLKYLVLMIFILFIFLLGGCTFGIFQKSDYVMGRIWPIFLSIFIFAVGYKGLMQQEIFLSIPGEENENRDNVDVKTAIPREKIAEIIDKLTAVMISQKPYLDPKITLPVLADLVNVPRNYLSQAINEEKNQNFYDYINSYRIEAVKEILKDPDKTGMNILNIAYEAGFNSKATFNASFKKHTNLTPTEYKKRISNF